MTSTLENETCLPTPLISQSQGVSLQRARIAIVHYWFVNRRGGERVVETVAEMFPNADLFSLIVDPQGCPTSLRSRSIRTSFVQHIPGSVRWHRHLLPLYPLALEQFELDGYDLVLSSESGPAKGVITGSRTCHVCYCHSPMRYLWDFYHRYKNGANFGSWSRPVFALAAHYLRLWDSASATRVDHFVANSRNVASRIRKHYRRESTVIYPPVDYQSGYLSGRIDDYYLVVGQLVDYKRLDVAIDACNRLGRPLHVVGEGEQYKRLRKMAGPTIVFCGSLEAKDLHEQYAHCRALLFPGEEDFGIVPVEAMSFGRPVIAFDRGGATESVKGFYPGSPMSADSSSGILFREQTPEALMQAIRAFEIEEAAFSPILIRQQAERFDKSHFKSKLEDFLAEKLQEFQETSL